MESKELENYIRIKKITGENIQRITKTYKTTVYLIALVLYYQLQKQPNDEPRSNFSTDDMTAYIMKGISKIILRITSNEKLLKDLEEIEP